MILHVTKAEYLGGFRIALSFDDGRSGVADLSGTLDGPVFEELNDPRKFAAFSLDPELRTIAWPNGADLAPEFLYFLAFRDDPDLQDLFARWGYAKFMKPSSAVAEDPSSYGKGGEAEE
jgi:hypothetical protein